MTIHSLQGPRFAGPLFAFARKPSAGSLQTWGNPPPPVEKTVDRFSEFLQLFRIFPLAILPPFLIFPSTPSFSSQNKGERSLCRVRPVFPQLLSPHPAFHNSV
jgi:hypothetical protein